MKKGLFVVITMVLLALAWQLSYKEDIQDFLPFGKTDRQRMAVYQDISGMNRLFVIFTAPCPLPPAPCPLPPAEQTTEAIRSFVQIVEESDTGGWCRDMQWTFDIDNLSETMDFIYQNIPLFLSADDYRRMDSLLAVPSFMDEKLADDLNTLMLPSAGILSRNISSDPLGLFLSPLENLQQSQHLLRFEMYDGYVFTPDMSRAIVMLSSPFGSSETDMNARLVSLLDEAIGKMQALHPGVEAHVAGGPQIAVGNAHQIVRDSILAVTLAAVLILLLLLYAFRSLRDILLIALSVGWGWLFALAGMALVHDSVSMIVIGISSVIIGIAVNYPLHLIAHTGHQPDVRQALREITKPLLVGNITTVGAFLALVPLKSIALRDLGLFASLLLVGTILFVLLWLPHLIVTNEKRSLFTLHSSLHKPDILDRLASVQIERSKWTVICLTLLTLFFGYHSLSVEFDTDLANINYMTDEQKADMSYFGKLLGGDSSADEVKLYLLSSAPNFDEALKSSESRQAVIDSLTNAGRIVHHSGVGRFLPSSQKQAERIELWNDWVQRHPNLLSDLDAAAQKQGFAAEAFTDFKDIISSRYTTHSFDYFQPLTSGVLAGNVSQAGTLGDSTIVDVLTVGREDAAQVRKHLPDAFDIASLHSSADAP